jgi:UDP-sulfoquinovose synthase
VLNRFVVQAVAGSPLTVYGKGNQTRGMLNIKDTVRCIELALLNPAQPGEYRVFNQFTESFTINEMAALVVGALGVTNEIQHLTDPRVELEEHYYNAAHTKLVDLGLVPHLLDSDVISHLAAIVRERNDDIDLSVMEPTIQWRATASPTAISESPATLSAVLENVAGG